MRKINILVCSISRLVIFSCNKKNNYLTSSNCCRVSYLHIVDYSEGVQVDTLDFEFTKQYIGNNYHYVYKGKKESVVYEMDFFNDTGYIYTAGDTCALLYRNKNKHILYSANEAVEIYQYDMHFPHMADGDMALYFSPSVGLILKRSTTWSETMELLSYTGEDKQYAYVRLLISLIYMEMYYSDKGQLKYHSR